MIARSDVCNLMQTVRDSKSRGADIRLRKSVPATRHNRMPTIRPYLDSDWDAVLEICVLAFTPVHESFERLLGTELFSLVYPDWKTSNKDYLRSLTNSDARDRFLVAEQNGWSCGFHPLRSR